MDDLTVMKRFRAERDAEPPEAREAIWRALEARMDAAAAEARAFGEAVAGSAKPASSAVRRDGFWSHRRRLLAFAGATAVAAAIAGALVLSSGPTAQPASAAEILHEAAAAASDAQPTSIPGPGQYYFRAEERLDVQGWISPVPGLKADTGTGVLGGTMDYPNSYNALVPTKVEQWTGSDGSGRRREVLGHLQFWDRTEEERWKAAGSPLPAPFNPEFRRRYPASYRHALELNSHVVDLKNPGYGNTFHFPDTSKLPTEAKALRQEAEANELEYTAFNHTSKAKHLDTQETKEELLNILQEGEPTPQLQAAIFDALAELPGIEVEPEATDGLGREGAAIQTSTDGGVRAEIIFDPETGELLAWRATLVEPAASSTLGELPAGTVINERAYIEKAIVDSTQETGQRAGPDTSGGAAAPVYQP